MNTAAMTLTQLRYVNKAFWRNPASAFFTFVFPLMFLAIFTALLGNGHIVIGGRTVSLSTYYVAGMTSFAVITACYNNIAISLTFQRDLGVLKRTNGTPLPAAVYLTAQAHHCIEKALRIAGLGEAPRRFAMRFRSRMRWMRRIARGLLIET